MAPSAACTRLDTPAASPKRDSMYCCTNDVTTLSGSLPTLTRTVRDRIVGRSASGSLVVRTMNAVGGGSSSAFSTAFAAPSWPFWAANRSASPKMKTARESGRCGVERVLPPLRQDIADRLLDEVDLLVGVGPLLRQLHRDEPMQIRVAQVVDLPARRALPAGLPRRRFTQERLGQPEGQPLLPNPLGPLEQQRLGQAAGANGICEALPKRLMAGDMGEWHCQKSSGVGGSALIFVC